MCTLRNSQPRRSSKGRRPHRHKHVIRSKSHRTISFWSKKSTHQPTLPPNTDATAGSIKQHLTTNIQKSQQLFQKSQQLVHENLEKSQQLVHENLQKSHRFAVSDR
eukprot:UN08204